MVFAVPVECGEHDGEDGGGVVADQAHDVPGGDVHDAHNIQCILYMAKARMNCSSSYCCGY